MNTYDYHITAYLPNIICDWDNYRMIIDNGDNTTRIVYFQSYYEMLRVVSDFLQRSKAQIYTIINDEGNKQIIIKKQAALFIGIVIALFLIALLFTLSSNVILSPILIATIILLNVIGCVIIYWVYSTRLKVRVKGLNDDINKEEIENITCKVEELNTHIQIYPNMKYIMLLTTIVFLVFAVASIYFLITFPVLKLFVPGIIILNIFFLAIATGIFGLKYRTRLYRITKLDWEK